MNIGHNLLYISYINMIQQSIFFRFKNLKFLQLPVLIQNQISKILCLMMFQFCDNDPIHLNNFLSHAGKPNQLPLFIPRINFEPVDLDCGFAVFQSTKLINR